MANSHLVILNKFYLDAILAGRKTLESRFMKNKRSVLGQVQPGDKLFLKLSSGPVCAVASVRAVWCFEDLTPQKIAQLRRRYNKLILGSDRYWRDKADCKYGLLVRLDGVRAIKPVRINKKDWRAWVVLTEQEDFGLLKMNVPQIAE